MPSFHHFSIYSCTLLTIKSVISLDRQNGGIIQLFFVSKNWEVFAFARSKLSKNTFDWRKWGTQIFNNKREFQVFYSVSPYICISDSRIFAPAVGRTSGPPKSRVSTWLVNEVKSLSLSRSTHINIDRSGKYSKKEKESLLRDPKPRKSSLSFLGEKPNIMYTHLMARKTV